MSNVDGKRVVTQRGSTSALPHHLSLAEDLPLSPKSSVLTGFPHSLVMEVSTSEPRDALQSERTCLTFIRFSSTLLFAALGIVLNFKFNTSTKPSRSDGNFKSKYSTVSSYILVGLSIAVLILSAINYLITISRYASHKIQTYSFNNFTTIICMSCIVITLLGLNIALIVEGYTEES